MLVSKQKVGTHLSDFIIIIIQWIFGDRLSTFLNYSALLEICYVLSLKAESQKEKSHLREKGIPLRNWYTLRRIVLTFLNLASLPSPGQWAETGKCLFIVVRQTGTTIKASGHEATLNRILWDSKREKLPATCFKLLHPYIFYGICCSMLRHI